MSVPTARRSMRAAAVVLLAASAACARPTVAPRATAAPDDDALRRTLDSLVQAPAWRRAQFGVLVLEAANGAVVAEHRAAALMIPASNQKLITAAVALAALGPDFTFSTVLASDAPLRDGVLEGDLLLLSDGDPSWSDRVRGDGRAALDSVVQRLRAGGLQRVRGELRAGPSGFTDGPLGSGWAWDDLGAAYAASVGDLMFNDTYASAQLVVGTDSLLRARRSDRPALLDALGAALSAQGLLDAGRVSTVRAATRPQDTLLRLSSPPLAALLPHFLKPSQNQHGELWLKTLGRVRTGVGRADSGRVVVQRWLQAWGVPDDAAVVRDGSGLSRHNLLSAEAIALVLQAMAAAPTAAVYREALPIAAVDGTLARRLNGSAAAGRLQGKTGSLDRVRALSGYVTDAAGRERIVVTMVNHFPGSAADAERALDAIVAAVAASTGPGRGGRMR